VTDDKVPEVMTERGTAVGLVELKDQDTVGRGVPLEITVVIDPLITTVEPFNAAVVPPVTPVAPELLAVAVAVVPEEACLATLWCLTWLSP